MKPSVYRCALELATEPATAFDLFSSPRRLDSMTPPWFTLRPKAEVPRQPVAGAEIEYNFRWRGVPLPWKSRIVEWERPSRLTYEQIRGPYRSFRHEHLFESCDAGCRVTDVITYRVVGGRWIARTLVQPDLERIFRYRAAAARRWLQARPNIDVSTEEVPCSAGSS